MDGNKNQLSDFIKLLKKIKISYLDKKDDLPKKVGVIGNPFNSCYYASIDLVFKLITYRKKILNRIEKIENIKIHELEEKVLSGDDDHLKIFYKYFQIEYFSDSAKLADALNTGVIDFGVVPSKAYIKNKKKLYKFKYYDGLIGSTKILLSSSIVKNYEKVVMCLNCDSSRIKTIYSSKINEPIINSNLQEISNSNPKILYFDHSSKAYDEFISSKEDSAFVCSNSFFKKNPINKNINHIELEVDNCSIEYRFLKHKNYDEKDDNAYPPSIHRNFRQLLFFLWKHKVLKSVLFVSFSILLFFQSFIFTKNITVIKISEAIEIDPLWIISVISSILIYIIFKLINTRTRTKIRLNKVKGHWLLYTKPTHEIKEDPNLYSFPRGVKIDFTSDKRHLEFEIFLLTNDAPYLKSDGFFLDVQDSKHAKIVLTYSNNQLIVSKKNNDEINGIGELDCKIKYESSNLYEMHGHFFNKGKTDNGVVSYYRLSDKEDFDLLMSSSFIEYVKETVINEIE